MKKCFILSISLIITTLFIVSCNKAYDPTYTNYVTTVAVPENGSQFYFVSDDSVKIYPISNEANYKQQTGDRLLIQYTLSDKNSKDPINICLKDYYYIHTQNILSSHKPDTLGRDGSKPLAFWRSGGVYGAPLHLNIDFIFMASQNNILHNVDMNRDTIVDNRIDKDGYYHINFHHNANNDYPISAIEGIVSFPLTEEYTAPGIKGLKIRFDNISDKDTTVYTLNY